MKGLILMLAVLALLCVCSGADAAWGRGCAGGQCGAAVIAETPHPVAHAAAVAVTAPVKATANVVERVRERKPVRRFLFPRRCH